MKTLPRLALILLLVPLPALPASYQSPTVEVTVEPEMPASLRMSGLSNGRVRAVVDVSSDGNLMDWLIVSASHKDLIRPCIEALQSWRYRPARFDGQRVQGQLRLTIDLSQTGAVVSRDVADTMSDWVEKLVGRRFDYDACPPGEIDRPPAPIATVAPRYPEEAEKKGVRGKVKVFFYIDERGLVRMPAVPAEAHPYLSSIAIAALREWKFEPPTRSGRPVLVAASQEFSFGGE